MAFLYDVAKLLECPVCFETYENPKGLWCGHTLCQKCFTQLISYNFVQCPLCRTQTRCLRNGPPSLYIVQDFIQLYNKEKESQKYLSSILPILPKRLPSIDPPKEPVAEESAFTTAECTVTGKSLVCLDCSIVRDLEDLWICTDCSYRRMCSRCGLQKHGPHAMVLYTQIVDRRKVALVKWRQLYSYSLDNIYKNRTDIDFNETRIKLLRLQVAPKKNVKSPNDVNLLNLDHAENDVVDEMTQKTKEKFANLRDRLIIAQSDAFLSGPEENFFNELKSLPMAVEELKDEQQVLMVKQKRLQDDLSEIINPRPVVQRLTNVPGKRYPAGYQRNQRDGDRRPYHPGGHYQRAGNHFRSNGDGLR